MNDQQLRIVLESIWKGEGASKAASSLKSVDEQASKAQTAIQKFNAGLKVIESSMVAVAAAGAVFKTAFDMAEAGAQIQLAQERFDNLAASINANSADILAGIMDVTGGMLTQAQAVESANQIISLGLADTGQGVVDLAGLVANLGWDMQTVILTFANDSKMRLDALGLSVTDVEARMKKFQAAGHDASEAFDLAVLDAGRAKLELLGSAADSNAGAWARLRVQITEVTDGFKVFLADGLSPVVSYMTGSYAGAISEMASEQLAVVQTTDQLIAVLGRQAEAYRAAGDGGLFHTNMERAVAEAMMNTMAVLAQSSGSVEEFGAALTEAGVEMENVGHIVYMATGAIGQNAEVFYQHQRAVLADAQELQRHMAITEQASTAQENLGISLTTTADRLAYAALVARDAGQAGDDYEVTAADIAAAEQQRAEAHDQATAAMLATAAATEQLQAALDNIAAGTLQTQFGLIGQLSDAYASLADAQGVYVQTTVDNSSELADLSAELASDLSEEQEKAWREILKTTEEGSAAWLSAWEALQGDLTATQRNNLIAQMADLNASHGEMQTVYTGDIQAAQEAQEQIEAAQKAISTGYKQMVLEMMVATAGGVFTQDAADFAVAVGLMSQAEADARLEAQRLVAEQERLVQLWQDGKISAEDLGTAAGLLADGFASGAEEALKLAGAFDDAYGKGNSLKDTLLAIEGEHYVNVTTTWTEVGEPPNIPDPGGGPGEPTAAPMAAGGWVTGGILGQDSVPAVLMPGEYVMSTATVGQLGGRQGVENLLSLARFGGGNRRQSQWLDEQLLVRPMAAGGWVGNNVEYRSAGLPAGLPVSMAAGGKASVYNDNRVINHHYHTAAAVAAGRAMGDWETRQRRNQFMGE